MLFKLSHYMLKTDDAVNAARGHLALLNLLEQQPGVEPIKYLVTLAMVTHEDVVQSALNYIQSLLKAKEEMGFVYFLSEQPMLIPVQVFRQSMDMFIDCRHKYEIMGAIETLARKIEKTDTIAYEITLVELYYFFILLQNKHLTWLALESMVNSFRQHTHVIMSPHRKYPYRKTPKV